MARTPARALTAPLAAALLLMAGCADTEPAAPAAAPVLAAGEIQLVDAPASSAGLTGDGRGDAPAPAATTQTPTGSPDSTQPSAATTQTPTDSSDSTQSPAPAPSTAVADTASPAKWVQLSVNQAAIGPTVTDVTGFSLYSFAKDSADPPASQCTGECATSWPPVLIQPGGRVFVDGMKTDAISAIRRSDGGVQVTIGGRPAYRFSGDTVPGELNGQGSDGAWFAFASDGKPMDALISTAELKAAKPDRTATLTAKDGKDGKDGPIVVDDDGATLYRFDSDDTDPPASNCKGACAALWQPVVAKSGGKVKLKGIDEDRVWWLSRKDGSKHVTLDGSPLYRNVADSSTGTIIASAAVQGWTAAR